MQAPTEASQDFLFENIGSLVFTEKGESLVHVTSFGLMIEPLHSSEDSFLFQLYTISRFHTVGTAFVFEALNHDTGFLNIHILEGSVISAKSIETGLSVAIQLKLQSLDPHGRHSEEKGEKGFNEWQPMLTPSHGRKTSFFSETESVTVRFTV